MKEREVITDIEQLTPEWLTDIFKDNGFLNKGKVTTITRNSLDAFSSRVNALELTFSEDNLMESVSSRVIIKTASPKAKHSQFFNKKEVEFYNLVAGQLSGILIPICYDAKFSEETGQSHIILEDLSTTHNEYKMTNWPLPPLKRYYERAIDCLAEFHAYWWDHKRLTEISQHSYFFSNFRESSSHENEFCILSIPPKYETEEDILNRMLKFLGDRISDERKELFRIVFSLFPQIAYDRIKRNNITLLNCDAHIHHFFYPKDTKKEQNKVKLIDWQGWSLGMGCKDLVFMIGLWWYSDRRTMMETELVKRYHNNLLKYGVKNYSWDDCWDDYRLCAFLNLYRVVLWWNLDNSPGLWWDALERSFNTIEDLKCMELLED
ncbi:MAG: hypothetical protein H7645_09240 [Candidatus Heimdallarchaeota archaeon]|nr:hypothetical protein [Candidatus Heimdallarchaeota archaeon]MCK4770511.1 hypothetical protein [Candidatus Heimdallarchaeota archaeon]